MSETHQNLCVCHSAPGVLTDDAFAPGSLCPRRRRPARWLRHRRAAEQGIEPLMQRMDLFSGRELFLQTC
jgi:hypothetical protein